MNTDSFTGKKTFLLSLICMLLPLLCLTGAAGLFLYFFHNPLFFAALAVLTGVFAVCALMLCLELRRTEREIQRLLDDDGSEPVFQRFSYSPAVERLLAEHTRGTPRAARQEENRRRAQYLALQNQINPHFLYNTLEAIRSEALVGGLSPIADMTETLANFFRYTISNTSELVTLAEEIKNVRDYFTIQRFRFGERIDLNIQIPLDGPLQFYRLPKLILQPIVENAIIHGLEERISGGRILVGAEVTPDKLIITIEDNGRGMEHEKLIAVNRQLSSRTASASPAGRHGGIAMYNVNDRLRLLFGPEYGLTYKSMPHIGTTVEVTLPLECGEV